MTDASADDNGNGVVDPADYAVDRQTLGQSGPGLAADGNGNNQINSGDYDVWRAHFGQSAGSGASVGATDSASALASVPEPTSILVALLAVCSWLLPQRWR